MADANREVIERREQLERERERLRLEIEIVEDELSRTNEADQPIESRDLNADGSI